MLETQMQKDIYSLNDYVKKFDKVRHMDLFELLRKPDLFRLY